MLKILLGQRDTECFPDALPGRLIAHKTGEVTGIYADGGIIYGEREREDFILVIMREYDDDREQTLADMRHLASFFNREAKP